MGRLNNRGQSLVELLIAIGIATIVMLVSIVLLRFLLRLSTYDPVAQSGTFLSKELMDQVTGTVEGSWGAIGNTTAGTQYRLNATSGGFVVAAGTEVKIVNAISYTRYFTVDPVLRDATDAIATVGTNDPSTKKVTVVVTWAQQGQPQTVSVEKYFTRTRNEVLWQTDWVGGPTCSADDPLVTGTNNRFCTTTSGNVDYTSEPGSIKIQRY